MLSPVMDPVIHEKRKGTCMPTVAPSRGRVPVLRRLVADIAKQPVREHALYAVGR